MSGNITSWLWILGFGLLFFWMMRRGGCGGGHKHAHGGHDDHSGRDGPHPHGGNGGTAESGAPRDPVCGMPVTPGSEAGMREIDGRRYYFCSKACLARFNVDPAMFASHDAQSGPERHTHRGC